jgi:UDP-N-acetylglucosamine acyltransferase
MDLHPSAVVSPGAKIGRGTTIGPFVVIEEDVIIGDGNRIGAHAVIKHGTRIGDGNRIHEHAVIGGTPQDLKFTGAESFVQIGNRNDIREGVTVHRGSREGSCTVVGDDNMLMVYVHVAHDCRLGNGVIIANNVALAGEVEIDDKVFISGGVVVHQFTRLGRLSMIGGNSKITQDVLPFFVTDGIPPRVRGVNLVGLRRAGHSRDEIRLLKEAYRILLGSGLTLKAATIEVERLGSPCTHYLAEFLRHGSPRGFHRRSPASRTVATAD